MTMTSYTTQLPLTTNKHLVRWVEKMAELTQAEEAEAVIQGLYARTDHVCHVLQYGTDWVAHFAARRAVD